MYLYSILYLLNKYQRFNWSKHISRILDSIFGHVFGCNLIAVTRARVKLQVRVYWKLTSDERSDVYR